MSKILKRVTVVAGVAVLGVASLAGCTSSSKKASSMFEVMGAVTDMKQYTYEITSSIKASDEDFEIIVSGKCDGNASVMSFEMESVSDEMSIKLEDFIITTQNMVYINVDEISSLFTESETISFDFGAYGITGEWISIEVPEGYEQPEYDFDKIYDELDKTYADYIVEKDGKFILEVTNDEVLNSIIDTTAEFIGDNSEQWSKDIADAYNDIDVENLMKDYIADLIEDINDSFELGLSEDDINEVLKDMDSTEMEISASDIKESFDDMKEELIDAKEYATLEGSEFTITAFQDGKSYVTKAEFANYEEDEKQAVEFKMVVTEDTSVKVEVPTEKVQTLVDVIGSVIEALGFDEQIEDLLEGMSGMDSYDDYDDYDDYDEDDDFSSIFDDEFDIYEDDDFSSIFDDEFDIYEDDLDDYESDLFD